jgi:macrolide transport system ATP-binding/permease protein
VAALRGVDAARGDRTVLEGVDLALYGGERIAVAGPNGAGKTTLLSLLLGTLAPSAGEIDVVAEVRLLPQRPHELAATGPLLPWFRRHARRGIDEGEARTLLAHFGLGEAAVHRPVERLSPGQRSRAAIAAIVASGADLLLLDEPTNHLDFDTLEVLERALAASPSTIVAVSHDRWFLDAIGCTRTLDVRDGRVREAAYAPAPAA